MFIAPNAESFGRRNEKTVFAFRSKFVWQEGLVYTRRSAMTSLEDNFYQTHRIAKAFRLCENKFPRDNSASRIIVWWCRWLEVSNLTERERAKKPSR